MVDTTQKDSADMGIFPSMVQLATQIEQEARHEKKQDVLRIVEALIAGGGYDLDPEETVDVAFKLVDKINKKLME